MQNNQMKSLNQLIRELLLHIGEDPEREGLKDTPRRVAEMYGELFSSLIQPPPKIRVFKNEEKYSQLIVESDISYFSCCEHHLVPFFGVVHIGYIPHKHYVGLSKLARVVDYYAHKPQIQERMTHEIAEYLFKTIKPEGVIVVVEAEHLCLSMRGIKKPRHNTITSCILPDPEQFPKDEFFQILKMRRIR